MESSFMIKQPSIEVGDVVEREKYMMDLYMVAKGASEDHYLIDLSNGEMLDFGAYSIRELVELTGAILVCKNEDLYITNKK